MCPDPFNKLLLLDHAVQASDGQLSRVTLRAAFSPLPVPNRKRGNPPVNVACTRAEIILNGEHVVIVDYTPERSVEVDWANTTPSEAGGTSVSSSVDLPGVNFEFRHDPSSSGDAQERRGKARIPVLTVTAKGIPPRAVRWTRDTEPGGRPFLIGNEEVWADVKKEQANPHRMTAEGHIRQWDFIGPGGRRLPPKPKVGLLAFFQKEEYELPCMDPEYVEILLDNLPGREA